MDATESTDTMPSPQAKRKRSTRNLMLRGASALASLGGIYLCLRWDVVHGSGWAWTCALIAVSLPCLREFYRLASACEIRPFSVFGYVMGPLWLVGQEWDLSGGSVALLGREVAWPLFIILCVGAMLLQLTRKSNDNALNNVALTIFGVVYCSMLMGMSQHMRHMQLSVGGWPMHGVEFVVTCIFIAKVSDVGALLTGSRWGRHKLIPRLSPGKTIEGAIGGLLFSVLLLQFMALTAPWMALAGLGRAKLLLLSVLLAAGGLAGDLIESAFKRNSQRKDAGTGVPGFGGVLDLLDSLMIATPVMYFFLLICGAKYVTS